MGLFSWLSGKGKNNNSGNATSKDAVENSTPSISGANDGLSGSGANNRIALTTAARMRLDGLYHGSLLAMGIAEGNLRILESGLDNGEDPNVRYTYEEYNDSISTSNTVRTITPIVQAAVFDSLEMTKLLIERGADPNLRQMNGESALANAANRGNVELTRYLLEHGADPNLATPFGTPLSLADGASVMRVLLEHGADPNIPDGDGDLPIIAAMDQRRLDEIELLIRYGTDMRHRNNRFETPIDHAKRCAIYGDVMRLLGAETVPSTQTPASPSKGSFETPDLFYAALNGDVASVRRLLSDGASPDVRVRYQPAIYQPIMDGNNEICFALLDAGADPNIEFPRGLFPIYVAAELGNLALVKKLLECGAEIDKLTPNGNTALRNAAEEGHYRVVEYLLDNGADADSVNRAGLTIADAAEHYGHFDIADLIRQHSSKARGMWPDAEDGQYYYLFRAEPENRRFVIKSVPCDGSVIAPMFPGQGTSRRFLDKVLLNCTSEDDLFDTMTRCASPLGIPGVSHPRDLSDAFAAKHSFFKSLRDQAEERGLTLPMRWSISGQDYSYSVSDVLAAFNLKSLALLALPAYVAMDCRGNFIPVAPNDPHHSHVFCPVYSLDLPSDEHPHAYCFDDYYQAFADGTFANNNSSMFLAIYGLAQAIGIFLKSIDWSGLSGFDEITGYVPLAHTLESLVSSGAVHSPFIFMWKEEPSAEADAIRANSDLAGALKLTEALTPIELSPYSNREIIQIFYGLIQHFNLWQYFGLSRHTTFRFVSYDGIELGHRLAWRAEISQQTDSMQAYANVPGAGKRIEFTPGEDLAPRLHVPTPEGKGSVRLAMVWDVPATIVETDSGQIHLQGLRQTLEAIDSSYAEALERESVYEFRGLSVIAYNDFHKSLEKEPLISSSIIKSLGLDVEAKVTSASISWKSVVDSDGDFVGFEATIPDAFNRIYWYPDRMRCPKTMCITPSEVHAGRCYIWDLGETRLGYDDFSDFTVCGVRQLCEKRCPEVLDELEAAAFAFNGIAIIPEGVADEAFQRATDDTLEKKWSGLVNAREVFGNLFG